MKAKAMKGFMDGGMIWIVIGVVAVIYVLKYLPVDVSSYINNSPVAFLLPGFTLLQGVAEYPITAPVGAIVLIVIFAFWMKK